MKCYKGNITHICNNGFVIITVKDCNDFGKLSKLVSIHAKIGRKRSVFYIWMVFRDSNRWVYSEALMLDEDAFFHVECNNKECKKWEQSAERINLILDEISRILYDQCTEWDRIEIEAEEKYADEVMHKYLYDEYRKYLA